MAVYGIKRKKLQITIPVPDYELLKCVAEEEGYTAPGYVRRLVTHHLWNIKVERYIKDSEKDKH